MGLRGCLVLAALLVASGAAAANEPVRYAVASADVDAAHFPHAALCVGPADNPRHRGVGGLYHFDPDGCAGTKATAAFLDGDGNGRWGHADTLVVRPRAATTLGPGQLIATTDALTAVTAQDPRLGRDTFEITGVWDFEDRDGDGRWSNADAAYLDVDRSGHLTPNDLRLDETLQAMRSGAPGMLYPLVQTEGQACFVDDNGDLTWQTIEPTYLLVGRPCAHVEPGDVRMYAAFAGAPASIVRSADRDVLWLLEPLPTTAVGLRNADAIVDHDGSRDETAKDFRFGANGAVGPGATGAALPDATRWAYLERDGAEGRGPSDTAYLDRDGDGYASTGDIRFGALFGQNAGKVVQPDDPDALRARDPARPGADTAPRHTDEERQEAKDSPAPHAIVSLLVGIAIVAHRTRRT